MGKDSKIQWTDYTWNPFYGCKKVSDGCKFCYMYRDKERYGEDPSVVSKSKTKFYDPLSWNEPAKVFTCSWSDFFIEEADNWRDELWEIIRSTPHLTYQILTKRPERIPNCLPADWGDGYPNVWLGVSVENQSSILRCEILGKIPAAVRFISAEPLLEKVDFEQVFNLFDFHWVIIGGESGNNTGKYRYRKCEIDWIESIVNDCQDFSIPVFVKQLGTYLSKQCGLKERHGGDIDEWNQSIQIREFPVYISPILPFHI